MLAALTSSSNGASCRLTRSLASASRRKRSPSASSAARPGRRSAESMTASDAAENSGSRPRYSRAESGGSPWVRVYQPRTARRRSKARYCARIAARSSASDAAGAAVVALTGGVVWVTLLRVTDEHARSKTLDVIRRTRGRRGGALSMAELPEDPGDTHRTWPRRPGQLQTPRPLVDTADAADAFTVS